MNSQNVLWAALGIAVLIGAGIYMIPESTAPSSSSLARLETATRMHAASPEIQGSGPIAQESLPTPEPHAAPAEDAPSALSKEAIQEARTPVRLYRDARVKPVYDLVTNQVEGVRILDVQPGSFWAEMGLRSQDVILEFNGSLVDSPASTVALMKAMSQGQVLSLRLRANNGEERFAEYRASD